MTLKRHLLLTLALLSVAITVRAHPVHRHDAACKATVVSKLMTCLLPYSVECSMVAGNACFTYVPNKAEHVTMFDCLSNQFAGVPFQVIHQCFMKCVSPSLGGGHNGEFCVEGKAIGCYAICAEEKM